MKNLNAAGLLVACIFAFQSISAHQEPVNTKALLQAKTLSQLPSNLHDNTSAIQNQSTFRICDKVALNLGNFEFAGELIESIRPSAGVQSMNIRSTSIPGAMCTVSVITQDDNTQKLVGRIINPQSDEVMVLTEENNRYYWVKKPKAHFLVN